MQLSANQYQKEFILTAVAADIKSQLLSMESDPTYITKATYSPLQDEAISFCDKHFTYISTHPAIKPNEYMANLRLMTRTTRSK